LNVPIRSEWGGYTLISSVKKKKGKEVGVHAGEREEKRERGPISDITCRINIVHVNLTQTVHPCTPLAPFSSSIPALPAHEGPRVQKGENREESGHEISAA
jgi:hypothetical protein